MIYWANTISIPERSIANTTSSTKQTQTHTPSEPKSKKKRNTTLLGTLQPTQATNKKLRFFSSW